MRSVFLTFICILLLPVSTVLANEKPSVSAVNAVLMDQTSGRVLFEKQAHEKQPVASITKIMTAILAVESGKMSETARASKRAVHTEGSAIYLEQGEEMTVKDLVYGLMLRSGNDAAVTLSEHIGGSVEGFVHLMNEKAAWLGMTHTHFENPHGLHSDHHYSSAYDMALLMRYAMNNEVFREIAKTRLYKAESRIYAWKNKNKLLTSYKYCTGGKTGFTKKAGRTLVTSAQKDGMDLIAVTLNAPDDWNDHIGMYNWAYDTYALKDLEDPQDDNSILYPLSTGELDELTRQTVTSDVASKTFYYLNGNVIGNTVTSQPQHERTSLNAKIKAVFKRMIGLHDDG